MVENLQAYLQGDSVDVGGFGSRISWLPLVGESKVPVNVFGSGPRVIDAGARLGDKLTVAVGAEPDATVRERSDHLVAKEILPAVQAGRASR